MTKQIGMLTVALLCACSLSGQVSAADEQLMQAAEVSTIKEFSQLAMLTTSAVVPAEPAAVVKEGDLAKFVQEKVTGGQSTDQAELTKVLSESVSSGADETFRSYIADPIPADVHLLAGKSIHWKGFSAELVFTANSQTFDDLKLGYNRIPFERLKTQAQEWFGEQIAGGSDIQCYFRNDDLNKYYLFWDSQSGKVFFKGMEG